jgi:hypothetical protein
MNCLRRSRLVLAVTRTFAVVLVVGIGLLATLPGSTPVASAATSFTAAAQEAAATFPAGGESLSGSPTFTSPALNRPNRRVCPGPPIGTAGCHARVITDRTGTPMATSGPTGYGPPQFHGAYELPTTASTAQTIAIVDAYDDPTIEEDLAVYSSTYGLPACTTENGCFSKVNQTGQEGSYPNTEAGWALEIALDVETAHAICQNCRILLVEATTNSFSNLNTAVNEAATLGATEISNSYGGPESSGETSDTAYNHPGIAITVSAGDSGYGAEYPASSPYVVAVGGTTLTLGAGNSYGAESVWAESGSGCSTYVSAHSWQTSDSHWAATGCGVKRGVADVGADANPSTGTSVYDTTKYKGQSGWFTVGGTSLSAPLIAAVYALAGGGGANYPAADPYSHQTDSPASLHDVTSGSNGSCGGTTMCKGATGYDGPTGVGTPKGIAAFAAPGSDTTPPQTTITSSPSSPTNDSTPSFSFSSSEGGSTFECRVDSGSFASCSSPYTATPLADGAHTFEVRATDAATNTDPTPAIANLTIDTAIPTSQADSLANTNSTTIPVTYTASDIGSGLATVELWVKTPGAGSYTKAATDSSPSASGSFLYGANSGDGTYSFYTRATDKAGNYEAAPASADSSTMLDTTVPDTEPPETTISSGLPNPTSDSTPTFTFSSSEFGSTFECSVDGETFAPCSSPYTTALLTDGAHSFEVRATDSSGNTDKSPAKAEFTVDTHPPEIGLEEPAEASVIGDATPMLSGVAGTAVGDSSTVKVKVYEGVGTGGSLLQTREATRDAFTGAYSVAATTLASGTYTVQASQTDSAGNTGLSGAHTFTVDIQSEPGPAVILNEPSLTQATTPPDQPPAGTGAAQGFRVIKTDTSAGPGSPVLMVHVPGPGTLVVIGRKVRKMKVVASGAGTMRLPIRPKERFKGRVSRAKVTVIYTPTGGSPTRLTATIRFG